MFFELQAAPATSIVQKREEEDLYAKLKSLQRQLEFLEIQVWKDTIVAQKVNSLRMAVIRRSTSRMSIRT